MKFLGTSFSFLFPVPVPFLAQSSLCLSLSLFSPPRHFRRRSVSSTLRSLSRRVLESVREETRTIFALGKDCSNRRFARHSVGNCAKLGPNVSQGLSRLATSRKISVGVTETKIFPLSILPSLYFKINVSFETFLPQKNIFKIYNFSI